MGTVYLARHPFMGRQAAIKILKAEFLEDRTLVARFMNEARAVNAIRHPNTISGTMLGTPRYMSPEQCLGANARIDHRTDIYSLGIILYQLLCGVAPFMSEGFGDVLMKHMTEPPRPPRERRPDLPVALEAA